MSQQGTKRVGVSGFYNIIVNLMQLRVFVGLTLYSLLVMSCNNRFNIQQLYTLPALYLCILYLSEKKQRLVPLTA